MKVTGSWKVTARKHIVFFFFSKIWIDFGKVVRASGW